MNTFEAIAHIRSQSLKRTEATRFLMEHLGFSSSYANEIIAAIFTPNSDPDQVGGDRTTG